MSGALPHTQRKQEAVFKETFNSWHSLIHRGIPSLSFPKEEWQHPFNNKMMQNTFGKNKKENHQTTILLKKKNTKKEMLV